MIYLEYLKSILQELDYARPLGKFYLICSFQDKFRFLMKAYIKQHGYKLDN